MIVSKIAGKGAGLLGRLLKSESSKHVHTGHSFQSCVSTGSPAGFMKEKTNLLRVCMCEWSGVEEVSAHAPTENTERLARLILR